MPLQSAWLDLIPALRNGIALVPEVGYSGCDLLTIDIGKWKIAMSNQAVDEVLEYHGPLDDWEGLGYFQNFSLLIVFHFC